MTQPVLRPIVDSMPGHAGSRDEGKRHENLAALAGTEAARVPGGRT